MSSVAKIPGLVGSGPAAGKVVVFANIPSTIIKETGEALAKLALKKAGKRLASKLFLKSRAWQKAFVHVAEHFNLKALAQKAVHTVFVDALRSRGALEGFLKETALKPTRKIISRMTIDGVPAGKPVVVLEREFSQVIGETFAKTQGGQIERKAACKILRIIVDFTGRPITAYPVSEFL